MAKTVQFRDMDSVLTAYKNRDTAPFAICSDKDLHFKFEGSDVDEGFTLLEEYLHLLIKNQSAGIYTLRVYEELPKGGRISNTTPFHGSFNFRFLDSVRAAGNYSGGEMVPYSTGIGEVMREIKKLNTRLDEMENQEDPSEEPKPAQAAGPILPLTPKEQMFEMLKPLFAVAGAELVERLFPGKAQMFSQVAAAASGAKVNGLVLEEPATQQEKVLHEAVKRLTAAAPDIPELLSKLADMAERKPADFAFYKNMLKQMQL